MKLRVLVLGAGFGGLELSSILSEELGADLDLTLIDKNDSFFFGFSKLDVMFGRKLADAVRIPYRNIIKAGVDFRQETITSIDPEARRVTTDKGTYAADILVVASAQTMTSTTRPVSQKAVMSSTPLLVPKS